MKYKINLQNSNDNFSIPTYIIEQYINNCSGLALKVLLILLSKKDDDITEQQIAEKLNVMTGDIREALYYWITLDVICIKEEKQKITEQKTFDITQQQSINSERKFDRSRMTRSELNQIIKQDEMIKFLVEETEKQMSKCLTMPEIETLVSMYSYCGISIDLVLMGIAYCKSINKCNMNYIKRVVLNWYSDGIDTHEKAEKYIQQLTKVYKNENLIKSAFGIDRKLSSKEQKYIEKWFEEYKFDIKMVRLSYERTIDNIGKVSFAYIDTILESWNKKNIKTPKQATDETMNRASYNNNSDKNNENSYSFNIDELDNLVTFGK